MIDPSLNLVGTRKKSRVARRARDDAGVCVRALRTRRSRVCVVRVMRAPGLRTRRSRARVCACVTHGAPSNHRQCNRVCARGYRARVRVCGIAGAPLVDRRLIACARSCGLACARLVARGGSCVVRGGRSKKTEDETETPKRASAHESTARTPDLPSDSCRSRTRQTRTDGTRPWHTQRNPLIPLTVR